MVPTKAIRERARPIPKKCCISSIRGSPNRSLIYIKETWRISKKANTASSTNEFLNSRYFKKILDLTTSASFLFKYKTTYINNRKVIITIGSIKPSLMTSKTFFRPVILIYPYEHQTNKYI